MGNLDVHFSSDRQDWETPQEFYEKLNEEFHFEIDICATCENAKHYRFVTPEQDALSQDWYEKDCKVFWMNPPYGREIGKWIAKAYQESQKGCTVVCLLPARTDTRWWHDYCMKGEIRFIRGRLKFVGSKYNAPFPNAVVIFRPSKAA